MIVPTMNLARAFIVVVQSLTSVSPADDRVAAAKPQTLLLQVHPLHWDRRAAPPTARGYHSIRDHFALVNVDANAIGTDRLKRPFKSLA